MATKTDTDTTVETTDTAVETSTESKAREGKQFSAIVYEAELVEELELVKVARRIKSPSDLVRAALAEFAETHKEDADRARAFFAEAV